MSKTIESETSGNPFGHPLIEDLPFFTRPHTLEELVPENKRHRFNTKEIKRGIYSPELLDYLIRHHPDVKALTKRKGREMFIETILHSGEFNHESKEDFNLQDTLVNFTLPTKNFLMPQCIDSRPISDKSWIKRLKTMAHTLHFQQEPNNITDLRTLDVHPYHSGDMFVRAVWLTTFTYIHLSSDSQGIVRRNYHKEDGYRIHRVTVKLEREYRYPEDTLDSRCQSKTVDVYVEERGPEDVVLHLSKTHWGDLINYGGTCWDLDLMVVCNNCGHEMDAHLIMSSSYKYGHNMLLEEDTGKRKENICKLFCDHLWDNPLNYVRMQCSLGFEV